MTDLGARLLAVVALLVVGGGCRAAEPEQTFAARLAPTQLVLGNRTGVLADYPCSRCHARIGTDERPTTRRHRGIRSEHFEGIGTCDVCHDPHDRDQLRLLAGRSVGFDAAHELCGQCHGEKLHDWRIGAHGKHVGGWAGVKHRFACTDCHDPHAPARTTVIASPPPPFPYFGIPKQEHP